jgi:predicted DsbA family dithiol-disulfide isomerase
VDERLSDPSVKQALRDNTEEAIARGVFGVPTLIVDEEIFWGHDAADQFLDYLSDEARMKRDVFAPVDGLAEGSAQRKPAAGK